jgi:hypothetical protein
MAARSSILPLALFLLSSACSSDCDDYYAPPPPPPRPVSILVEVYDPVTNMVWEDVSVRVVEADQEWLRRTVVSPYVDWYLTDASGRVLLDEYILAYSEVGFAEDGVGRAMIGSLYDEDEATVVLEVFAVGYMPVIVEVPLRWDLPDVFVEVPFQ